MIGFRVRAVEQAIKQAEAAFAAEDYDRAEHLAEVVLRMARRDAVKFQADPNAWMAKHHQLLYQLRHSP